MESTFSTFTGVSKGLSQGQSPAFSTGHGMIMGQGLKQLFYYSSQSELISWKFHNLPHTKHETII